MNYLVDRDVDRLRVVVIDVVDTAGLLSSIGIGDVFSIPFAIYF